MYYHVGRKDIKRGPRQMSPPHKTCNTRISSILSVSREDKVDSEYKTFTSKWNKDTEIATLNKMMI